LDQRDGQIRFPLEGAPALTHYRTLERRSGYSIVDCMPVTGRTNQIRIHFKRIGHPLVGEDKFAFRKDFALKAKRVCLHARSIAFVHPVTRASVTVEAPLAGDMAAFLEKHR
jgi:23S rRNA pseudouridine1911/1915/1917 synthase